MRGKHKKGTKAKVLPVGYSAKAEGLSRSREISTCLALEVCVFNCLEDRGRERETKEWDGGKEGGNRQRENIRPPAKPIVLKQTAGEGGSDTLT